MKKVLKQVLKELRYRKMFGFISGLCAVVSSLQDDKLIDEYDAKAFDKLLNKSHKNQTEFYDHEDRIVSLRTKYHWPRGAFEPREQWLIEQINLLS